MVPEYIGAEFVRGRVCQGRVCQGPSLLGAEMSRNHLAPSPSHLIEADFLEKTEYCPLRLVRRREMMDILLLILLRRDIVKGSTDVKGFE